MGRSSRMHALPSFTFVLTSTQPVSRSRYPSVFIEPESPVYLPQATPTPISKYLMKTIDQPTPDGRFLYSDQNDSTTTVGHDDDDAKTIFEEKRPTTSRPKLKFENGFDNTIVHAVGNILIHLRKLGSRLPLKMTNSVATKSLRH